MNDILRISIPVTVWIAAFSAIYGLEGVVCSRLWVTAGLSLAQGRMALIMAWVAAIALQIIFLILLRTRRFASSLAGLQHTAIILSFAALVATLWSLMPVATTSLCM